MFKYPKLEFLCRMAESHDGDRVFCKLFTSIMEVEFCKTKCESRKPYKRESDEKGNYFIVGQD